MTVTLYATDVDGPADIAGTSYSIDSGPLLPYTAAFDIFGNGPHVIHFSSVDKSSNAEETKTLEFSVDQAPPTITSQRSPDPNANGWNSSPVTITFQCSDALSGLASGPPPPTTVSTQGARQSVQGTCMDLAGNVASLTMGDISIDTTPPSLNAVVTSTPNANGWNNTPAVVTFVATDELSGVGSVTAPVAVNVEGAGQVVVGSASDKAGNTSSTQLIVNLDVTPPEGYFQFDPVAHDVAFYGRDQLSGVAPGPFAPVVAPTGRTHEDEDRDADRDEDDPSASVELRTYKLNDLAGNSTTVVARVRKHRNELDMSVVSIQYGTGPVTILARNRERFAWDVDKGKLTELDQSVRLGQGEEAPTASAEFDARRNRTSVLQAEPEPSKRLVKPGLVLLRLATSAGALSIEY